LAIAAFVFLYPGVAHVSQVHVQTMAHDLKTSVREARLIVVGRDLKQRKTVKEIVLPKSTHHKKQQETIYREYARRFEVKRVIKSDLDAPPRVGSVIEVWVEPAYDEHATRLYHEQGIRKSPIAQQTEPRSKPTGDEVILFLEPHQGIFRHALQAADEGLGALAEVEDRVHGLSNPALWSMEDRSAFHQDGKAVVIGEDGTLFVHIIENQGERKLSEQKCTTRLDEQDLARVRKLVETTRWENLEFTGTLIPDETRPFLFVGLGVQKQWRIEPARPGPELDAYQAILRIAFEKCASAKREWKKPGEIDFQAWPARVREITQ
jgi:hypothetical protein